MVEKRILCPDRVRRVPRQFSWVDHRLVRDKHLCGLSPQAHALYLLLVTVGDADGLSYYSDAAIERTLGLCAAQIAQARTELCRAGLIAYQRPLYQVLSLERSAPRSPAVVREAPVERAGGEPTSLGNVLRQALGGGR